MGQYICQFNSSKDRCSVGFDTDFQKEKWMYSVPSWDQTTSWSKQSKIAQSEFSYVFLVASTGGTAEPGEENCRGVQDLLPSPLPCRPPLLPEIQVCKSRGGSGDHTSHMSRTKVQATRHSTDSLSLTYSLQDEGVLKRCHVQLANVAVGSSLSFHVHKPDLKTK